MTCFVALGKTGDVLNALRIIAHECEGRVEFHHHMTYASKRVNALWAILPLCHRHHYEMKKSTKAICNMNMRMRIRHFNSEETFRRDYPRSTLFDNL